MGSAIRKAISVTLLLLLVPAASMAARVGEKAPPFTLKDLDGNSVNLSDFRGRVVFMDFWASWCASCERELPALDMFLKMRNDSGLVVLAINVDSMRSRVEEFFSRHPLEAKGLTVLLDPEARVMQEYKLGAMPTSLILDEEGVIRFIHYGFREKDPGKWAEEIEKLGSR